jgi:hypothetical protein
VGSCCGCGSSSCSALIRRVSIDGDDVGTVAREWLVANDLL